MTHRNVPKKMRLAGTFFLFVALNHSKSKPPTKPMNRQNTRQIAIAAPSKAAIIRSKSTVLSLVVLGMLCLKSMSIAQSVPGFTEILDKSIAAGLTWTGGTGPFLLQKKIGVDDGTWINVISTSNRSVILSKATQSG